MPGMTWNAEADSKLLLSILADVAVKPNFEAVAKRLTDGDTVCTVRAVQERIKKLKKQAQDEGWSSGASDADGGAVQSASPKAARGRKKKADGAAEGESPTKKRKAPAAKKAKSAATVEDGDAEVNDDDEEVKGEDEEVKGENEEGIKEEQDELYASDAAV